MRLWRNGSRRGALSRLLLRNAFVGGSFLSVIHSDNLDSSVGQLRESGGILWDDGVARLPLELGSSSVVRERELFTGEERAGRRGLREEEAVVHSDKETQATVLSKTVAACLFGFLFVNMALLYLVHWKDADIRVQVYKMVCVTISIFCAVLLNQAIEVFLLEQVIPTPFPRGFGVKVTEPIEIAVGLGVTLFMFASISFLCFRFREQKTYLYAIKNIVGHLCAFAAIFCFGKLQQAEWLLPGFHPIIRMSLVFFMAQFLLFVSRLSSIRVRDSWGKGVASEGFQEALPSSPSVVTVEPAGEPAVEPESGPDSSPLASPREETPCIPEIRPGDKSPARSSMTTRQILLEMEEEESQETVGNWTDAAEEGEDEAWVVSATFLTNQIICYAIMGEIPGIEGDQVQHTQSEVNRLWYFVVLFLFCSGIMTCVRVNTVGMKDAWALRITRNWQMMAAISMMWCLFRIGDWQTQIWTDYNKPLAHPIGAFAMSMLSVCVIVLLDAVADKLPSCLRLLQPKPIGVGTVVVCENEASQKSMADQEKEEKIVRGTTAVELTLRTLINGFGVLVGLSWEKAFNSSLITIVTGFADEHHRVLPICTLSLALVAFVLPAWRKFIVPKALKTEAEHKKDIMQENARLDENIFLGIC